MKQKGNIIPKYPEDIALRVRTSDSIENCIFEIAGKDHLFIRTQKGILPLKMSKNDYLRLFPPIKRFNIRQGPVGDCYYMQHLTP